MIPTFDAFNLIRAVVRRVLSTISNPIVIVMGLTAAVSGIITSFFVWATDNLAFLPDLTTAIQNWHLNSDLAKILFYVLSVDTLATILNGFLNLVVGIFIFACSYMSVYLGALVIAKLSNAYRQAVKDQL